MFCIWILADNSPVEELEKMTSWAGLIRRMSWLLLMFPWATLLELPRLATLSAEGDCTMKVTVFFLVSSLESEEESLSELSPGEEFISRDSAAPLRLGSSSS